MTYDFAKAIPGYTIMELLGETHYSTVYRAGLAGGEETVIIKVIRVKDPSSADIARFRHEYELISRIDIDGIIKPRDFIVYEGRPALVLEDFGGVALKQILSHGFELERFLNLAIRLARILGKLHQSSITHRDINPHNILMNPESDTLKITDFGISAEMAQRNEDIRNYSVLEGTLAYISPEQTGRMNCVEDYRTDLYSLGVTFYEMLTGQVPFQSNDPMEIVHAHIAMLPLPPCERCPDIPGAVSDIVMKLLSKSAADRYQNSFGLADDLRECLHQLRKAGRIEPFTLGSQDISLRFIPPQGVVGRDEELELLHATFDRISHGAAALVLVTGDPGIGKSALVNELHKPIVARRGYFIAGKFDQSHRAVPYSAIIQAFQGLARQLLAENDERLRQWKERLLAALGPNGKIITDAITEIGLIIGQQPDIPELGPEEARNRFNLVFKNFVRVFADQRHPLVVFLDDLQWADSASIHLLETIATDPNLNFLLFIGAYRDRETPAHHPFMLTRDAIQNAGLPFHTIHLSALVPEAINQLIASFLHCAADICLPLARAIHAKTKGNPFFVNQFLKSLYDQRHLILDPARGWTWDLDQIEQLQVTDNVVQFMADKLQHLPADRVEIIQTCACIGNRFDLETLTTIAARPIAEILSAIDALEQDGLINRQGDLYHFHHDRIQEAAYGLLSQAERERIHYLIGQLDLKRTDAEQLYKRIFYLCDQLNKGRCLISAQAERNHLAALNLKAGLKAKESTAYKAAVSYLVTGGALLAADAWQSEYDIAYALHIEQMECQYLDRNFDEAERLFKIIIANARTKLDKAKAYNIMIMLYTNTRSPKDAIRLGIEALGIFGVNLKMDVGVGPVIIELIKAKRGLKKVGLEKILDLPMLRDQELLAVYELLLNLGVPAYYVNPHLFAWIALKALNISGFLQQGLTPHASVGLIVLANIIQATKGDYALAFRIGRTALKLNERFDNPRTTCMLLHTFAFFIQHWKRHVKFGLEVYPKVYELSLNSGNFTFAGISIANIAGIRLALGHRLDDVLDELYKYKDFMALLKDPFIVTVYLMRVQWIRALKGLTPARHDVSGNGFNLSESIAQFRQEGNNVGLCYMLNVEMYFNARYGRYEEARQAAAEMVKYIKGPMGSMLVADHCFNYSLILIALLRNGERHRAYKGIIRRNQRKMQKWAEACPENFKHQYDLVAAELAGLEGRCGDALKLYHAAIDGAHDNEFLPMEAMACERLADFYMSANHKEEASLYIRRAHRAYLSWGATAKVDDLGERYADLLHTEKSDGLTGTRSGTAATESTSRTLDLSTVMQVSQAISSEIMLEGLLQKTMHMCIANAGAQRGYLILESDGRLSVQASEEVNTGHKEVLQAIAVEACDGLSPAIVNYVYHSGEPLILDNAVEDGAFINDAHVLRHRCKSILCLPIVNNDMFKCFLYMENNLTTAAFTPERLEILRVISAQAAISLQNARLYEDITTEIAVRKKAEASMRASEEKYRTILEEMQDLYCEMDLKGTITFINPSACALTGFTPSELIGSNIRNRLLADERNDIEQYFHEIYITGRPGKPLSFHLMTKSGTVMDMEIVASPIRDKSDNAIGFRGVGRDVGERKRLENDLIESYKNVHTARTATVLGLAKLAEYRDEETGAHLERIREYARIIARELATKPRYRNYITAEYIEDIYNSAILHDIGKVGVPDAILLKPGKLTKEEFEIIKTHSTLGGDALLAVEANIEGQTFLTLGKEIAYYHHEKWDGSGYPKGLKGEEIPLSARIVALADVYDALTSKRVYKAAFSHRKAVEIILKDRGTHFAPDVADAFLTHAEDFRRIREELLGT